MSRERYRVRIKVCADKFRLVLFEGPQFPLILDRFTALAGRKQLPPYWAFAPWKARDYHRNQQEVNEDIDRYRELGLPASVILIDSPWATNYNTYEFNPKQFANAPADGPASARGRATNWCCGTLPGSTRKRPCAGEDGFKDKIPTAPALQFQ